MIHFDNISKRYPGGHQALGNINLRLPKGEMAFLTGTLAQEKARY
jgi:cell division transport system ATP-binding protein